ncbi:MAG: DUF11 domain-containing protein [Gemmatimonadota bacterium]|nr:MAG: DUF11 domain-containing protein [Gemmatimonadota bacterium]
MRSRKHFDLLMRVTAIPGIFVLAGMGIVRPDLAPTTAGHPTRAATSYLKVQGTWPVGYTLRRQITVTTGPTTPVNGYQGYTVRITGFDSASEIAAGEMRADGNDLRVFYWDGASWIDVPRIVTGINTADTHIIFQCQAGIPASSSDANYYMYYGNAGAGLPPAVTRTNVYLWQDDFSTDPFSGVGRYTLARAVDVHGNRYRAPSYSAAGQNVRFNTNDNFGSDMYISDPGFSNGEQDVLITVDQLSDRTWPTNGTNVIVARLSAINTSSTHLYAHYSAGSYPNSPAMAWDTWTNGERNALGGSAVPTAYWSLNQARTWALAVFGTTARFWDDGDIDTEPWFGTEAPLLTGTTPAPQFGYVGVVPAQARGWWDNLIVRRYTEPEPAMALGAEEGMFADMNIAKSVNPAGIQTPGTELTYTIAISNLGNTDALSVVVADTLPTQVDFRVGSVVSNLPPGVSVTVDYSNDGGATWTYVPVSGGCGAAASYDRCVRNIRWTLLNDLSPLAPDNAGTLEFVAIIQ